MLTIGASLIIAFAVAEIAVLWGEVVRLRGDHAVLAQHNERLADRNWELEESECRARSALELQGDLIVLRDSHGRIAFANDAFCTLAAEGRAALIGARFALQVIEQGGETIEADGTKVYDQKIATPDGPRWISWREGLVRAGAASRPNGNASAATSPSAPRPNARWPRRAISPVPPTAPSRAFWRWPRMKSARP